MFLLISKFQDKHLAGGYLGINKNNLETLPIFEINSKNQALANKIIVLVDKVIMIKGKNAEADTSEFEREIDLAVYRLYGLSDEEIRIVEGNI